jgi:hypothetical protein
MGKRGAAYKILIGRYYGKGLRGRSRHGRVVKQLISGRLGMPAMN